jgi:hypothetical protein
MSNTYQEFLAGKIPVDMPTGIEPPELHESLFPFQRDIVRWALKRGRAALFEGTGLGKTFQQCEWARRIQEATGGRVLILAPLAVASQTVREAAHFGIQVMHVSDQTHCEAPGVYITNYQKLAHFDPVEFVGVVLDESSIIKHHDAKTRTLLIEAFRDTPFKLACTATPSPNDYTELGNHAEFLGVCTMQEMLATFFCHDGGETQKWRLKGHAEQDFWKWLASWAVTINKPSDLGYEDGAYNLPPLHYHEHIVETELDAPPDMLFAMPGNALDETRAARKASLKDRCATAAAIANSVRGSVLLWCDLNDESVTLASIVDGGKEVTGSDSDEAKASSMIGFTDGEIRALVSKPSLCGFGMNWQHCSHMVFVGVSHSFERFYQAVRRCWRFGQTQPVHVHIVISDLEAGVLQNIKRKEQDAARMAQQMIQHMAHITKKEIQSAPVRKASEYKRKSDAGNEWTMHLGDCVEVVKDLPDNSIHFSVFSPPFASLYTYSASERDMGNTRTMQEFFDHFNFLIPELYRVIMPGRLVSFHCMNLPTSKERDGIIGIRDFRGELIKAFVDAGFIFHSEVCIWKDPVTAMQRTKALGLLHKQIKKDSCMSRQGIPDYLVTMRKPGDNPERVTHTNETFPVDVWQRYASPVWMDINPSDTLQRESAREEKDERHICPLQLQVIERAINLWTNPGDIVLSPFAGIGSEGYVSIRTDRKFVGVELKESYYKQACLNLEEAEACKATLFDLQMEPPKSRAITI